MRIRRALPSFTLTLLLTSASVFALPTGPDDFEDGTTQGWTVSGGPGGGTHPAPPANVPTGGPAGDEDAFLRLTALGGSGSGSRLSVFNLSQWTGDYLAAGITAITMDVNNTGENALVLRLLLVNFAAGGAPTDTAVTLSPVNVPAGSGWMSVVFDLTNLTAETGTTEGALGDVNELRLFHNPDPAFGGPFVGPPAVVATLGVDNIQAVPEASTVLLLLVGGIMGAVAHFRRTKTS